MSPPSKHALEEALAKLVDQDDAAALGSALDGMQSEQLGALLLRAAAADRRAVAELLLSRGVDVDACDGHGQTALHAAAEHGHAAMTQLLLAYGADPFQCNSRSLSPMDAAASAGDAALVRAFSEQALFSGPVMLQAPSDHEQLWLRCHIVIAQQRPLAPDAAAAFTFQPGDHQQTDSVAGASAASTAPLTAEPWPAMWVMYSPQSGATTTNAGTATGTAATSGRVAGTVSSLLQSSSIGDRAVQGAAEGYGSAVEGELLLRLPLAGAYFLPVDESGEQHSLAMLVLGSDFDPAAPHATHTALGGSLLQRSPLPQHSPAPHAPGSAGPSSNEGSADPGCNEGWVYTLTLKPCPAASSGSDSSSSSSIGAAACWPYISDAGLFDDLLQLGCLSTSSASSVSTYSISNSGGAPGGPQAQPALQLPLWAQPTTSATYGHDSNSLSASLSASSGGGAAGGWHSAPSSSEEGQLEGWGLTTDTPATSTAPGTATAVLGSDELAVRPERGGIGAGGSAGSAAAAAMEKIMRGAYQRLAGPGPLQQAQQQQVQQQQQQQQQQQAQQQQQQQQQQQEQQQQQRQDHPVQGAVVGTLKDQQEEEQPQGQLHLQGMPDAERLLAPMLGDLQLVGTQQAVDAAGADATLGAGAGLAEVGAPPTVGGAAGVSAPAPPFTEDAAAAASADATAAAPLASIGATASGASGANQPPGLQRPSAADQLLTEALGGLSLAGAGETGAAGEEAAHKAQAYAPEEQEKVQPQSGFMEDQDKQAREQTERVKAAMQESLDQLLARGERLEALVDKSDELASQAEVFQRTGRAAHKSGGGVGGLFKSLASKVLVVGELKSALKSRGASEAAAGREEGAADVAGAAGASTSAAALPALGGGGAGAAEASTSAAVLSAFGGGGAGSAASSSAAALPAPGAATASAVPAPSIPSASGLQADAAGGQAGTSAGTGPAPALYRAGPAALDAAHGHAAQTEAVRMRSLRRSGDEHAMHAVHALHDEHAGASVPERSKGTPSAAPPKGAGFLQAVAGIFSLGRRRDVAPPPPPSVSDQPAAWLGPSASNSTLAGPVCQAIEGPSRRAGRSSDAHPAALLGPSLTSSGRPAGPVCQAVEEHGRRAGTSSEAQLAALLGPSTYSGRPSGPVCPGIEEPSRPPGSSSAAQQASASSRWRPSTSSAMSAEPVSQATEEQLRPPGSSSAAQQASASSRWRPSTSSATPAGPVGQAIEEPDRRAGVTATAQMGFSTPSAVPAGLVGRAIEKLRRRAGASADAQFAASLGSSTSSALPGGPVCQAIEEPCRRARASADAQPAARLGPSTSSVMPAGPVCQAIEQRRSEGEMLYAGLAAEEAGVMDAGEMDVDADMSSPDDEVDGMVLQCGVLARQEEEVEHEVGDEERSESEDDDMEEGGEGEGILVVSIKEAKEEARARAALPTGSEGEGVEMAPAKQAQEKDRARAASPRGSEGEGAKVAPLKQAKKEARVRTASLRGSEGEGAMVAPLKEAKDKASSPRGSASNAAGAGTGAGEATTATTAGAVMKKKKKLMRKGSQLEEELKVGESDSAQRQQPSPGGLALAPAPAIPPPSAAPPANIPPPPPPKPAPFQSAPQSVLLPPPAAPAPQPAAASQAAPPTVHTAPAPPTVHTAPAPPTVHTAPAPAPAPAPSPWAAAAVATAATAPAPYPAPGPSAPVLPSLPPLLTPPDASPASAAAVPPSPWAAAASTPVPSRTKSSVPLSSRTQSAASSVTPDASATVPAVQAPAKRKAAASPWANVVTASLAASFADEGAGAAAPPPAVGGAGAISAGAAAGEASTSAASTGTAAATSDANTATFASGVSAPAPAPAAFPSAPAPEPVQTAFLPVAAPAPVPAPAAFHPAPAPAPVPPLGAMAASDIARRARDGFGFLSAAAAAGIAFPDLPAPKPALGFAGAHASAAAAAGVGVAGAEAGTGAPAIAPLPLPVDAANEGGVRALPVAAAPPSEQHLPPVGGGSTPAPAPGVTAPVPALGLGGSAPLAGLPRQQLQRLSPTAPLGKKPPKSSVKQQASGLQHLSPRPDVVFDLMPAEVEVHESQVLGRGAMGRVLRGRYKDMDVAVKMLLPQFQAEVLSRSGGRHEDGDARGRARQRRDDQQDVSGTAAAASPTPMDVAESSEQPCSHTSGARDAVAAGGDSDVSMVPPPDSCSGGEGGVVAAPDSWAPASTAAGEAGTAYDEAMQSIRALELELQIMGRLDHPHVLRLHGACLRPPGPFLLVQELCRCSLHTLLYNRGARRLALREVLRLSIEIMSGLEYLHSLNIIHRDLKPGNVLIDNARRAKIADFGLARCKYQSYLSTNKLDVGTLPYMAPECFSDHYGQVSTLSDIYSAAVMIGEMVNHTPPWKGCHEFNIVYQLTCTTAEPHDVQALRCPPAMQQLLRSCFQRQAQDRPNASQVLVALQQVQKGMQQE